MNILHHKSWHVRNKDNIARVRRDETKAAEEAKKKEDKILRAEREARISFLRNQHATNNSTAVESTFINQQNNDQQQQKPTTSNEPECHLNLFTINYTQSKTNKEHQIEKKEEKEKYEKQIGFLTYLGQYQNEDPHLKRWYDIAPKRYSLDCKFKDDEVKDVEKKKYHDPMKIFVEKPKNYKTDQEEAEEIKLKNDKIKKLKKNKKDKKNKKEKKKYRDKKKSKDKHKDKKQKQKLKTINIEELREQRLKREAIERKRTDALLKKFNKN